METFFSGECCEFHCADSFPLLLTHNHQDTAGHRKCSKFLNQSEQIKREWELTSTGFPAFIFCGNFNKTNSLDLILSAPVLLLLVVHFVMAKQRGGGLKQGWLTPRSSVVCLKRRHNCPMLSHFNTHTCYR